MGTCPWLRVTNVKNPRKTRRSIAMNKIASVPADEAADVIESVTGNRRHQVYVSRSQMSEQETQPDFAGDLDVVTAWPSQYSHKLTTALEALKVIKSGDRVFIGGGCGEPIVLAGALVRR